MSGVISTTVFTTGAITTLAQSKPPLTTVFTQPSSCSTRWFHYTDGRQNFLINYGSSSFSGRTNSRYFDDCRPYSALEATYSPGICPDGKAVGSIDFYSQDSTSIWKGLCCQRYSLKRFNAILMLKSSLAGGLTATIVGPLSARLGPVSSHTRSPVAPIGIIQLSLCQEVQAGP